MADLFPLSVILHFPSEVYLSRGVGDLCPLLVRALHARKISALQFLRGGRVRVTFREPAFREELLSSDFLFEDRKIPVTPAGVQVVTVYVRDLPVEVSSPPFLRRRKGGLDGLEVYSVRHGFFKDFPDLQNGNRLILMSISNPIPSSPNVLGFVCRAWHPGQPVHCSICKESGHSPRTCPLSGLCRRCKQPGHVARECGQGRGQPRPSPPVDPDPVLSSDSSSLETVPSSVPTPKSSSTKLSPVLKKLVRSVRLNCKSDSSPAQVRQVLYSMITANSLVVSPSEFERVVEKACKSIF